MIVVVVLALPALNPGCADDSTKVGLAQSCKLNSDCNEGLVCSNGLCHTACVATRDCPLGTLCVKLGDGSTICQLPTEISCEQDSECQKPLVCGNDGKCRNGCNTDSDCVAPQVCAKGGFCAEQTEVDPTSHALPTAKGHDGGPVSSGGTSNGTGGARNTGGADASLGGDSTTGGATGSGGSPSSGGAPGGASGSTGGKVASGGAVGSGGATGGQTGTGGRSAGTGGKDAGPDAPQTVTLHIQNYLNYCSISDGGAPFSTSRVEVVPKGTVIDLTGQPTNGSFVWGYWTGTDRTDGGKDTNATTTVTMDVDKTVIACCPLSIAPTMPCN